MIKGYRINKAKRDVDKYQELLDEAVEIEQSFPSERTCLENIHIIKIGEEINRVRKLRNDSMDRLATLTFKMELYNESNNIR